MCGSAQIATIVEGDTAVVSQQSLLRCNLHLRLAVRAQVATQCGMNINIGTEELDVESGRPSSSISTEIEGTSARSQRLTKRSRIRVRDRGSASSVTRRPIFMGSHARSRQTIAAQHDWVRRSVQKLRAR